MTLYNITNQAMLHRLRGAVDSLTNSTLVRVASGRLVALANGRNRAAKSHRYVEYRFFGGGPDLPFVAWNSWKAIALPQEGDKLPPAPPIFGRAHYWALLEVPGALVAPLVPIFQEWLGVAPKWVHPNVLVRVALLDPILVGWGEDRSPIYQQASDQPVPPWWHGSNRMLEEEEITPPPLPTEGEGS